MLAEMKPIPVTHAGRDRPARKKSTEELTPRFRAKPIPITQTKKVNSRTRSSQPSSRTSWGAAGASEATHKSWARLMAVPPSCPRRSVTVAAHLLGKIVIADVVVVQDLRRGDPGPGGHPYSEDETARAEP